MSVNNFIPQVWSASMLSSLHNVLVFGQNGVINRRYEGEIQQQGNTVKITSIGPVTVSSYTKNTDLGTPETLNTAQQVLVVDQQDSFHFYIDDIDAAQVAGNLMDEAMYEAAFSINNQADSYLATIMAAGAAGTIGDSTNPIATLGTAGEAYKYLVQVNTKLNETNTPSVGRFVVVPPWFHGQLLLDERFVGVGSGLSDAALRNGMVGRAAGLDILMANTVVSSGTNYQIVAGHSMATTYAEQIVQVVGYSPEKRFGDAMKGLHVYGAKVIRPSQLVNLYAAKP